MNRFIRSLAVTASVALSCSAVFAEEEDGEEAAPSAEELGIEGLKAPEAKKDEPKPFYYLPGVRFAEGTAEVLRAGDSEWQQVEEGRYYPHGSVYRTVGKGSKMTLALGRDVLVDIADDASFGTRLQTGDDKTRQLTLKGGIVSLKLPRNFPSGYLTVAAPGFTVSDPQGESRMSYQPTGDGDQAVVRCVTGTLTIEGRHFRVHDMRAANQIKIRTSLDALFTGLYGSRGDCMVTLDQGLVSSRDIETGENKIVPKTLEWKLSPKSAIRIHRAVPKIGKNMSVHVMTFDAAGTLKNRCVFVEGRYEVNSGELAPVSKDNREALAKKAAEATEEVAVPEEGNDDAAAQEPSAAQASAPADDELEF